jgi:hypothetical protein
MHDLAIPDVKKEKQVLFRRCAGLPYLSEWVDT